MTRSVALSKDRTVIVVLAVGLALVLAALVRVQSVLRVPQSLLVERVTLLGITLDESVKNKLLSEIIDAPHGPELDLIVKDNLWWHQSSTPTSYQSKITAEAVMLSSAISDPRLYGITRAKANEIWNVVVARVRNGEDIYGIFDAIATEDHEALARALARKPGDTSSDAPP